jgi:transposase
MNRDTAESYDKEALIRLVLSQAETIAVLTREMAVLRARVVELEAKFGLPAKTPDNSSTPPSQGRKASGEVTKKPERKAHAHRPLHPNPAHKRNVMASSCQHCGTDVSGLPQTACEVYDRVEIPDIKPDVTRVTLHGGVCPCCAKKFKAAPRSGMEPGSPFGENLRALVIYLRFTPGIAFGRLARLLSDSLGLEISEGALVNMLDAARDAFARQTSYFPPVSCREPSCNPTRPASGTANGTGGCGRSTMTTAPSSLSSRRAAKRWSRGSSARFGPISGSRTVTAARWAGRKRENQVCLAHLIRDVQYAIDAGDDIFAPDLRHLLGRACRIGRRRDKLADATLKTYAARLEARLDELMVRPPTRAAASNCSA